jgi:type I restriction enzyme M protein
MLTSEIKQKIDSARNILVGKIPTPTGQVEQITLALIYKFMNDIDEQNKELGGTLKFFVGDYQKYAWKNLLDKSLSAYERVTAYGEGLEKMHLNPNLPQFFRNVFRGAFLPFRDPEVLTIFLKQIDEFRYGVNGDLGDAFEYLLQVMGTQGDAGQFLTPRHHINFIVSVVDPQKTDKTLDPAEGTAGFLISAYLHILKQNTKPGSELLGSALTYDERKKLSENFVGYDISHDMVRLSLVNLYLHGFADPRIYEYDTLGNVDRWDDDFDCILTNPPFMTPKGGVKPHKRFSIQAKRSEVLFVDYIMEHLNPNGKAGIIVPEGIIFQSATAYKALRKMMIDQNFLYAVVSLPAGIFQPYSGVKTSILFMDRVIAKKTKDILFVKVENDGFDLGAQRRPIDKNDLPRAAEIIKRYKLNIQTGKPFELSDDDKQIANLVPIEKIGKSGDYNLSGDRYKETIARVNQKWPLVELGEICNLMGGGTPSKSNKEYWENGDVKWLSARHISEDGKIVGYDLTTRTAIKESASNILPKGTVIFVTRVSVGKIALAYDEYAINQDLTGFTVKENSKLHNGYLYYVLCSKAKDISGDAQGIGVKGVTRDYMSKIKIPLPPLEVQQEIVSHLDSYQKIIDGAKQVVDNYQPEIKIDPEWEMIEIGKLCNLINGRPFKPTDWEKPEKGGLPIIRIQNLNNESAEFNYYSGDVEEKLLVNKGDLLFSWSGSRGTSFGPHIWKNRRGILNQHIFRVIHSDLIDRRFFYFMLKEAVCEVEENLHGGVGLVHITKGNLERIKVPLPPLDIQKQIVSRIEEEQQLVDATKKLIGIYQGKIKEKIDEVWGE